MMTSPSETRKPSPTGAVLEVTGLRVQFGGNVAVDDFNLAVSARERVGLIGPNGAGKSTCVNAITGYVKSGGHTILAGTDLGQHSAVRRARAGIVRTWQNLELFSSMTVRENVHFGAELSDRSRNTRRKAAADAMELLGLGALAERAVSDLSYGNRKIVELARALAADPRILLLDEPMAGLDTHEKRQFVDTLDMVFDNTECAVLLIEHDMFAVGALTHRVLVIDAGKTIASGTLQEVSAEQRVIDAYLGA